MTELMKQCRLQFNFIFLYNKNIVCVCVSIQFVFSIPLLLLNLQLCWIYLVTLVGLTEQWWHYCVTYLVLKYSRVVFYLRW